MELYMQKCELLFLSLNYCIDRIDLIVSSMPFIFYDGPEPISIPAPSLKEYLCSPVNE